VLAQDQSKHSF